jgi:hypothetical protein
MSDKEKQDQELFETTLKLAHVLSVKGAAEGNPQFAFLGHVISTTCKAITDPDVSFLLQNHINEFVDSVRMLKGKTKPSKHLSKKESFAQN